jgi:hypothetical protein
MIDGELSRFGGAIRGGRKRLDWKLLACGACFGIIHQKKHNCSFLHSPFSVKMVHCLYTFGVGEVKPWPNLFDLQLTGFFYSS